MAPLSWLILMIMFVSLLICVMTFTFFSSFHNSTTKTPISTKSPLAMFKNSNFSKNWSW